MSPQLAAEMADLEQAAVAEADRKFHDLHGAEADWSLLAQRKYVGLIAMVHDVFHADDTERGEHRAAA